MAVPNKRRFEKFLEIVKWNPSGESFAALKQNRFCGDLEPTEDYVKGLLYENLPGLRRFLTDAHAHPVSKWLYNQTSTKMAFKALKMVWRDFSDIEARLDEQTREVMNAYEENTDRSWYYKLEYILTSNPLFLTEAIATCLYRYHHTDHWKEVFTASRDAHKILTFAFDTIKVLKELDQQLEILERYHVTRRLRFLKFIRESELRLVEKTFRPH